MSKPVKKEDTRALIRSIVGALGPPRKNLMELVKCTTSVTKSSKNWNQTITTYKAMPIPGQLVLAKMGDEMVYVQVIRNRPVSVLQLNEVVEVSS